jgi:glycogen debranching enzyme
MIESGPAKLALDIAKESLLANTVDINGRQYLQAGSHQFSSLWTRDFCFSVPGLLALEQNQPVKDHLTTLLEMTRPEDGLVPRVLDSGAPRWRVIKACLGLPIPPLKHPLIPEFVDEHGTEAVDSNALLVIASAQYRNATGDSVWWQAQLPKLQKLLTHYDQLMDPSTGLIRQTAFADWQDSQRREGFTFYTQLVVAGARKALGQASTSEFQWSDVKGRFFDVERNLYRCQVDDQSRGIIGPSDFQLDVHVLGLKWGLFQGQEDIIIKALLTSGLVPGANSIITKPRKEKSFAVRWAGLTDYHEGIVWSWLMGDLLHALRLWGSKADHMTQRGTIEKILSRDQAVYEVYEPSSLTPVRRRLYRSESPFSWGAACLAEALLEHRTNFSHI